MQQQQSTCLHWYNRKVLMHLCVNQTLFLHTVPKFGRPLSWTVDFDVLPSVSSDVVTFSVCLQHCFGACVLFIFWFGDERFLHIGFMSLVVQNSCHYIRSSMVSRLSTSNTELLKSWRGPLCRSWSWSLSFKYSTHWRTGGTLATPPLPLGLISFNLM